MNKDLEKAMREAVDFLYSLPKFTTKNSLEHTKGFLRLLGSPCADRKIIHVAGSNGKGSVCSFLYHILLASGKSVGLFTSPHLVDIRERFCINGSMVSEEEFLNVYADVRHAADQLVRAGENHPTYFEFIYACGMLLFERRGVEYVVLETGLGGRLDATNSFPSPMLCVITSISLEHTEILGSTIPEIASEKAGILKPGVPVVYTNQNPEAAQVIAAQAIRLGCPQYPVSAESCRIRKFTDNSIDFSFDGAYDEREIPAAFRNSSGSGRQVAADLEEAAAAASDGKCDSDCHPKKGAIHYGTSCEMENAAIFPIHCSASCQTENAAIFTIPFGAPYQVENAALAIMAAKLLGIRETKTLRLGWESTVWPGRMQEVRPGIWFDGAHNPAGISAFTQAAAQLTAGDAEQPLLLFSMLSDKDVESSVRFLLSGMQWGKIAVCPVEGARGLSPDKLAELFAEYGAGPVRIFGRGQEAFRAMSAEQKEGQKLFVTGSLYFLGSLMEEVKENA